MKKKTGNVFFKKLKVLTKIKIEENKMIDTLIKNLDKLPEDYNGSGLVELTNVQNNMNKTIIGLLEKVFKDKKKI